MLDFLHMRLIEDTKSTNIKVMPDELNENEPVAVNAESTREEVPNTNYIVILSSFEVGTVLESP